MAGSRVSVSRRRAAQEMPRWLSSTKMETEKASQRRSCYAAPRAWVSPPTARTRPSRPRTSTPSSTARGSRSRYCCASRAPPQLLSGALRHYRSQIDIMKNSRYNTNHFVLAVDPSGGGASQFSIATMAQMPTGRVVVRRRPRPLRSYSRAASCPRARGQSSARTSAPATKASGAHEWRGSAQQQREHALAQVARERLVKARGDLGRASEESAARRQTMPSSRGRRGCAQTRGSPGGTNRWCRRRLAAAARARRAARRRARPRAPVAGRRPRAPRGGAQQQLAQRRPHRAPPVADRVPRPAAGVWRRGLPVRIAQRRPRPAALTRPARLRTKDVRATHKLVIDHLNTAADGAGDGGGRQAVLVLESNLAFEAQHILHALNLANIQRWVALSEGQAGTLGWLTTVRAPSPARSRVASPTRRAHRRRTE